MREGEVRRKHTDSDPERNLGVLAGTLQDFKNSVHESAERPDFFWKRQHHTIMLSLQKPTSVPRRCRALLWAPAVLAVVLCLLLSVETSKAPTPDFAAGSDQDLLVGIERALSRPYPEAFEPVAGIISEKKNNGNRTPRE